MPDSVHPVAYLAIEIKNRELDSRLMIASHLLSAGITVVLGQQWGLFSNLTTLPPGVFLFKTVNRIQASAMRRFFEAGHIVTATDEEVLLCTVDACFCAAFDVIAADNCHRFYAQSEAHKLSIERRFPQLMGKVIVTGNPRVDITSAHGREQYRAEAQEIRDREGPFVLINTNFAVINSFWGSVNAVAEIGVKAGMIDVDNPATVDLFNANIRWEDQNRQELLKFLDWAIPNIQGFKIVIRPHPGEQLEFWQNLFGHFPNVKIVPKSPHMPWIMAADLIVHTSCTTGLEAALLDKPVVTISPTEDPTGPRVTSSVNPCFQGWKPAANATHAFLMGGTGPLAEPDRYHPILEKFFPNYRDGHAAAAIANDFIQLLAERGGAPTADYKWQAHVQKFFRPERAPQMKEKMTASASEIMAGIDGMRHWTGLTRPVTVSEIDDSLFMLVAS